MWLAVSVLSDAAHAEGLSEALLSRGALSVSIEDADAGTAREQPQYAEPNAQSSRLWQSSRIVALFEAHAAIAQAVASASAEAGMAAVPQFEIGQVAEQDWVARTQSQFEPIRIAQRLWIVPSWHAPPDPQALNVVLDPGLAFGTGSHATTRLCLEWLCRCVHPGVSVLDYGCGSGILAIAAAKLGAARVVGVDIDEQALISTAENARNNGVAIELARTNEALTDRFDRVVANILTNPLCVLAPLLSARLARGGEIALAGVLEGQAEHVADAYRPYLRLEIGAVSEGWVRLEGTR